MYLNGTFPTEMSNLSKLRSISLTQNHISGLLPSELGKLTELEFLDLQYNQFTGGFPHDWFKISTLKHINLAWNPLAIGSIPPQIRQLSKLENVFLDDVGLTGTIPVELLKLPKLSK